MICGQGRDPATMKKGECSGSSALALRRICFHIVAGFYLFDVSSEEDHGLLQVLRICRYSPPLYSQSRPTTSPDGESFQCRKSRFPVRRVSLSIQSPRKGCRLVPDMNIKFSQLLTQSLDETSSPSSPTTESTGCALAASAFNGCHSPPVGGDSPEFFWI